MTTMNKRIVYLFFSKNLFLTIPDQLIDEVINPSLESDPALTAGSQILSVGRIHGENGTGFLVWGGTEAELEQELQKNIVTVFEDLIVDGTTDFEKGLIETVKSIKKNPIRPLELFL